MNFIFCGLCAAWATSWVVCMCCPCMCDFQGLVYVLFVDVLSMCVCEFVDHVCVLSHFRRVISVESLFSDHFNVTRKLTGHTSSWIMCVCYPPL